MCGLSINRRYMTLLPPFLLGVFFLIQTIDALAADDAYTLTGEMWVNTKKPSSSQPFESPTLPQGKKAGKYDIALLIANRNYNRYYTDMPDVDFAHNDLEAMKQHVINIMGFDEDNVLIEEDVTTGRMNTLFGTLQNPHGRLYDYVKQGVSRVFIYYVGHGAPSLKTGKAFLVPVDTMGDYVDQAGYSLEVLYRNLQQLGAKELIVVLDSCFSGRSHKKWLFRNASPIQANMKITPADLQRGAVLSSSTGNQISSWYEEKRHSLFTYFFLQGLRGAADKNKDKTITVGEMEAYVNDQVPYWNRRINHGRVQQPQLEGDKTLVLAVLP